MTTGSYGTSWTPPAFPDRPLGQTLESRSWSGSDGRTVVIDGFERTQYNNYTCQKQTGARTRTTTLHGFVDGMAGLNTYFTDTSDDDLKLLSKLAARVNEHQLQAGVAIAEGKKTIQLVKNSILTVGGALVDVKHGNFTRAAQRLGIVKSTYGRKANGRFFKNRNASLSPEGISSRWLELQYGWKPLLNDVYEACKAYELLTKGPRSYYYKASTKSFVQWDSSTSPSNYACHTTGKLTQKIVLEQLEDMSTSIPRSLGLEDPLTVAWELVPYSFVIDWFIPIGTYLQACYTIPTLKGRWFKTRAKQFVCNRVTIHNTTEPSGYAGCTYDREMLYIDRTTGNGNLNVPLPKFRSLDRALSPLHVTNAIALVTTALSGGRVHS